MDVKNSNGRNAAITALASSSNQLVQLGTLGAVLIGGLTSFFQTERLSEQSLRDREKGISEIHHIYSQLDDFERRQQKALENQKEILELLKRTTPKDTP